MATRRSGGISPTEWPDRWRIRWRDANGRQRERSIDGTRSIAERELRAELHAIDAGTYTIERDLSVADWLETWLALVRPGLAPRSLENYTRTVHRYLVPAIGRRRLVNLDERHVLAAMESWQADGATAAAITWRINLLRMALGRAVKTRRLLVNVATFVDLPRHRRARPNPPSDATLDAILARVKGHPYELAYALAIGTGMRQGEILGLRWTDLDLGRRQASVSLSRIYGTDVVKVTKTEAGDRTFTMPAWLTALLAERRPDDGAGFVVITRTRRGTDARNLLRRLHRIADELGVPRTNFRQIRHYATTRMLEAGVPMATVSRAIGHSSIAMTVDTYGHVRPDQSVADALER
jgi:integrase